MLYEAVFGFAPLLPHEIVHGAVEVPDPPLHQHPPLLYTSTRPSCTRASFIPHGPVQARLPPLTPPRLCSAPRSRCQGTGTGRRRLLRRP